MLAVARSAQGVDLPPLGCYATGICFTDRQSNADCEAQFAALAKECGLQVLCWRDVPVDSSKIGLMARKSEPLMRQAFLSGTASGEALNRQVSGGVKVKVRVRVSGGRSGGRSSGAT